MTHYYVSLEMTDWDDDRDVIALGPYRSYEVAAKIANQIQNKIDQTPTIQSNENNLYATVGVRRLRTATEARSEFEEWIDRMTDDEDDE